MADGKNVRDETGNKYGLWLVLSYAGVNARHQGMWLCQCSCGSPSRVINGVNLRSGASKSCGCLRGNTGASKTNRITHGMSKHPAYASWKGAKKRCTNPNEPSFKDYGARGIQFKLPSFEVFWERLGSTWFSGATIERKRNNGHYTLKNVRWATRGEQANNKSSNRFITWQGRTQTLAQWARELGIQQNSLRLRLSRVSVAEALSTPVRPVRPKGSKL